MSLVLSVIFVRSALSYQQRVDAMVEFLISLKEVKGADSWSVVCVSLTIKKKKEVHFLV